MVIEDELNSVHVTKHGMPYWCKTCGHTTVMWLEKGLCEGGETQKPVPFMIRCGACGNFINGMRHGGRDIRLPDYRPIPEGADYFKNDSSQECGIPVFANTQDNEG